jgi:PAS domain S-box-containing protein
VEVGGQKLFTVILRDITERRKAEEELRQQARLMDLAPLIVRDMSGRIVYWSRGAEKMYGFRKAEALGKISHELLRSNFPQPLLEISRILVSEGSWEGEIEHKTREGAQIFVSSQWVLYRDADENPVRILEVNSDISERKRASARLLNSQSWNLLGPCPAASPTISTTFCWPSMAMPGWRSRICRRTTRCRKA